MSVRVCYSDRHKMVQMIDQIKLLTNNLDELRAEIGVLKASYLESKEYLSYANDFRRNRNNKANLLHKIKKYVKQITRTYSTRKNQKSDKTQTAYYPYSNVDRSLPTFLDYVFHIKKKGDEWQIPTRTKYLKNQGNQTKENFKVQQSIVKGLTPLSPIKATYCGSSFAVLENKQYDNMIIPTKDVTTFSKYSDISCKLDCNVQDTTISSNSEESTTPQNYQRNSSFLNNNLKQTATTSTQTRIEKLRRKNRNSCIRSKYPNLSFSKIRNAVVLKKIVKNSNESTFTVCENIDEKKSRRYSKRNVCKCSCPKKKSRFVNSIEQEINERNISVNGTAQILKNDSFISDEKCRNVLFEEEPDLSSSSISVDLEVNISNENVKMQEYPQRRKPRTYVIRKTTVKHSQNNRLDHFERSVIYVGQTSDLTLSSSNVSNNNLSFN